MLRAVAEALDLGEGHRLTSRTARRFFRNSSPNGHSRREIFLAFGQTIIDMGFVPDLSLYLPLQVPSAQVYADSLESAARHWDAFMSETQSESSWDVDLVTAGRCFVNLATVDLALRLCALNLLAGFDVRLPEVPLWAEENGIGRILRKHTTGVGLSRAQLAGRIEVSETTVDNWFDGRHWPDLAYIDSLALEFSRGNPASAVPMVVDLKRQFALARLCQALSELVGRDHVHSAIDSVSRFARDLAALLRPRVLPGAKSTAIETAMGATLLLSSSDDPWVSELLFLLADSYADGERKDSVLAAARPWKLALGVARIAMEGPKSLSAGLAQDYLDVVDGSARSGAIEVREVINRELGRQVTSLVAMGSLEDPLGVLASIFEDGIAIRRQLVERFPHSPDAHTQLGSLLGMVGGKTGERALIDEGLLECRIASGLCPAWDMPAVERGIMLTEFGEHLEALLELEQVARDLQEPTPHWHFVTGYVLTELERFAKGLEHLEAVISVRPDYALAYRYAAHCAFKVGDSRKGAAYAKTGQRLGEPDVFDAWQSGEYRTRR